MSDRAQEIQAKLEKKREQQPKPPPPETQVCSECGAEFEVPKGGNIKLPEGIEVQPQCRDCYMKHRHEIPADVAVQYPRQSQVAVGLDGLGQVGVNVRRHGHLLLADLGEQYEEVGREFIQAVLSAGRYGEVAGLYVWGETGTGKSQFAVSIMHEFLRMGVLRPHEIVYDTARRMVTQLQDRYSTGGVDAFSNARSRARLWVYEDAGTEKHTPDAFRVVETIFDAREGHPTIVTSNLNRQELADRWSQMDVVGRFLSRLKAYRSVRIDGEDRR